MGDAYPIVKGNVKIGNNVRFKSVKSDPIIIGNASIGDNCEFHSPVQIGDGVFFNLNCSIFGYTKIGNNCAFGPNVLVVSYTHKIGNQKQRADTPLFPQIIIQDGVWIGAGAIILGGVTIGEGAVIGAGAVVTTDIPSNTLAVGIPAKVVKRFI